MIITMNGFYFKCFVKLFKSRAKKKRVDDQHALVRMLLFILPFRQHQELH